MKNILITLALFAFSISDEVNAGWINDHVVKPTKKHIVEPVKKSYEKATEYVDDRLGPSGPKGPKMKHLTISGDDKIQEHFSDDVEYEIGFDPKPVIDHYSNDQFLFLCESSVTSALKSPHYLFYPISRAEYCRLRHQHLHDGSTYAWHRTLGVESCNNVNITKNIRFFRCWEANPNSPKIYSAIQKYAEEKTKPERDHYLSLNQHYETLAKKNLNELKKKEATSKLELEAAQKKAEQAQIDIKEAKIHLQRISSELASRLNEIKERIRKFDQMHADFLNSLKSLKIDRYSLTKFSFLAQAELAAPDLSEELFLEYSEIHAELSKKEFINLCKNTDLEKNLQALRIYHANTRQFLRSYIDQVEQAAAGVDIEPYKDTMKENAIPFEELLSIKDRIYSGSYEAAINQDEACILHILVGEIIKARAKIYALDLRKLDLATLKQRIDDNIEMAKSLQKRLETSNVVLKNMQKEYSVCSQFANVNKLTESLQHCASVLERVEKIKIDAVIYLQNLPVDTKESQALIEREFQDIKSHWQLFVSPKIKSKAIEMVTQRRLALSTKIILFEYKVTQSADLVDKNLLKVLHSSVHREFPQGIPKDVSQNLTEAQLKALDLQFSIIETEIDNLALENGIELARGSL